MTDPAWALGLSDGSRLPNAEWRALMTQIAENSSMNSRILNGRRIAANREHHVRARRPNGDIARKVFCAFGSEA